MKQNIHPQYHEVKVSCSTCNKEYAFKSTRNAFTVDVCSGCHPAYTGTRATIKATGRIDRFNKRLQQKKQ
ncbi:50S ribosomal protein L31 [Mycoplasma nasistruthionis]|uniref:Large ribosomal subunit protein bL31 n=1 Tax=Mycoplasma nasistruthionis TaxID=353852 RepID=A0A4Y6I5N7_9MOLU|nr:50S ribosomal protein L31 [Mycoplasma nasistruthionis]QCZ36539.1 50S ribosomal protein L31 [Mycoplasma nasistruthionis]QDF64833.1 50S ribosomal protein L31 [Mycoplasma nasistruthionis]